MLDFQIFLLLFLKIIHKRRKKLRPIRFKGKAIPFLFIVAILPVLFSCATYSLKESGQPTKINRFSNKFIAHHTEQIGESEQLIFATNRDSSSFLVTIHAVEKSNGFWHLVFPGFIGSIGEMGFAAIDDKREGDGKSPTGVFPLGMAFGYDPSVETKMPYRQATDDDFWVDDVNSEDYNKWVKGEPNAASWKKMKRDDDQYKYGVVIEYNMHPIVKGKGSAIFLHVWNEGDSTLGCLAMSEEMVLKILGWLDPAKKPLIIMGTESELRGMRPRPSWGETKGEASARPPGKVVDIIDIKEVTPRIIVDMKYATEDNFAKKRLYDSNTCFLRKSVAVKLDAVQKELEGMNLSLKVWDCYRPLAVQRILWVILPDERYVANPEKGSRHNRASAVDVTLVDSEGKELQMPTGFDDFSPRAHHHYQDLPDQAIRNRELLKGLMEKAGFIPLSEEWWHYDDEKWMQFDLMDLSFQDLSMHQN
jgi:D-alanyl-D-alanine dipeptidase